MNISCVYHDSEGNLKNHIYFDWHLFYKLINNPRISYETEKVLFLNSKPKGDDIEFDLSNIIQFVDLLVGSVSYCFDVSNPRSIGQRKLAQLMLPMVQEINETPYMDRNWCHARKYTIGFFPTRAIKPTEIKGLDIKGECYNHREIKLATGSIKTSQTELQL